MTFTSILFLFGFLPIGSALFFIWNNSTWKLTILFLLSIIILVWNDPTHIVLLSLAILINYGFGIFIGKNVRKERFFIAKYILLVAVIINVSLLLITKYSQFIADLFNSLIPISITPERYSSPIGISYFCFTSIAYLVDVYWGKNDSERNLLKFVTYNIMFPKFIQGPITRYKSLSADLSNLKVTPDEIFSGIRRFIIGLSKKVLIADKLAIVTNKIFESNYSNLGADLAWLGLIAFGVQIYLDFSGYTDMAIGIGQIFGIRLPENFNQPYASLSITEFWRKWHISLTSWFRTYVFQPLEISSRKSNFNWQVINIIIVFLLTGLWHGASWNYVIWGGYFGIILAFEASIFGKYLKKTSKGIQLVYTLLLVLFGWFLFRIQQVELWPDFVKSLVGWNGWANLTSLRNLNILFYLPHLVVGILICIPTITRFLEILEKMMKYFVVIIYLVLFILCIATIITNQFTPFIYQQF